MSAVIQNIESTMKHFRKENSPTLNCSINSKHAVCVVDEGSEIKCCSYVFATESKLPIENVVCAAVGANKSSLKVMGITSSDIIARVFGTKLPCEIKIAKMIVVDNLGADVLLGQPTKIDNHIVTLPHKSQIKREWMV